MKQVCLWMLLCCQVFAQSQPGKLTFEAASIRPGDPGEGMELFRSGKIYFNIDNSRISVGSSFLMGIITYAFRVPMEQIVGPDWLLEQRFSIEAKYPQGATKEQAPDMLVVLLTERFKLTFHHELRALPVYAMTVAKDGPKFRESPSEGGNDPGCNGGFHKVCGKVTMENLAVMLSRFSRMSGPGALDRPVVDMTELKGKYDFVFDQGRVGGGRGAEPSPDAEIVTPFEALKVLGLKLEATKHSYDYVVIDHIERVPTEN